MLYPYPKNTHRTLQIVPAFQEPFEPEEQKNLSVF